MKCVVVASALSLLSACATTEDGRANLLQSEIGGVGLSLLQTLEDVTVDSETKTAKSGDTLLTYNTQGLKASRLASTFKPKGDGLIKIKFALDEGELFYPVVLKVHGKLFCTVEAPGTELLGPRHRVCLKDKDGDGKYDRLWGMDEIGNYNGVTSGFVFDYLDKDIDPPLVLEEVNPSELPIQKFGLRYTYNSGLFGSSASVKNYALIDRPNGKTSVIETLERGFTFKKDTKFPRTLDVAGVKIEILKLEDKAITYRIIEAPKKGDYVLMGRRRAPQVTYVYY